MVRRRSSFASVWVFALLSIAALAAPPPASPQEPSWLLLDPPSSGEVSSQGVSGEADTVYVLNGEAGVAESPLPQEFKDALVPPTEPGTISIVSEEEEEVFFVGKEIVEGIIASEAAGELTPEIAAIAEPLDEETTASSSSEGSSVDSVTANSIFNCATHEKTFNKSINLSDKSWSPDPIDLGGGFTGSIKIEGDLEGQANLELKFNVKRKKVGFNCVPWSASFKNAHITGNATSDAGITLTGAVNYQDSFGPWEIAKPHLFTVTFSVGWVPVTIGFNLPVTAGLSLASDVTGTVNYNGTHVATGTFDYTCTLKSCTGTSDFSNVGENGATQVITGGVDGRIKPTAWVDVAFRAYLYTEWIAYAQVGVRPHLLGDLWGYTGNACGDANADGHFETARSLTFDLDTRIDWTAQASAFGSSPWKKTLKTGSVSHFRFWDLIDSSAMEPHFHGPGSLYVGDQGDYKIRMRPCWPYTENVTYQVNWGDGAAAQELQGAPGTEITASHTWSDAGSKAASVTAVKDEHGRTIDQSTPRTIEVLPITPLGLTVTPAPASITYGNTITLTATATGGHAPTIQYTLGRRLVGTTSWLPTPLVWQASNILTWTPGSADVGSWELAVGVKDRTTAPDANGLGYAAAAVAGTVEVVAPLTLTCPAVVQRTVTYGNTFTWSGISSTGGTPGTIQYTFSRQLTGNPNNPWLPDPLVWQTNTAFSWTPAASDLGTWQFFAIARDVNTPADPGYSSTCNMGQIIVVSPLTVSVTPSPATSIHGNPITWTATANGGTPASTQFAFFRRKSGATAWTPDVTQAIWQGSSYTWTPGAADVGTWEIVVWVKDGNTPANANTYGYSGYANAGPVKIVTPPLGLSVTVSPAQVVHGNPVTVTATATGGTPATTQYAFFRRRSGTTPWTPDVTQAAWQASRTFTWTPASADVGTWEIYVWVKDGDTPATMNTYGYAAGANGGSVKVTTPPLTLTSTASPAYVTSGNSVTWTATATGGTPSTTKYALLRRRTGTTAWIPDISAPVWQTSNVLSWTPASADTGTWELMILVKDGDTPTNMNTYGYAASYNPGNVQVVAPLTLTATVNPSQVVYGNPVTWTATANGGVPATTKYAFFRRRSGATAWIPDATTPVWQSGNTFTWTPASADVGTWDTYVWVKDGNTPANANTYGYAAGFNTGPVKVVTPPLTLSVTPSPSSSYYGITLNWTATAGGGTPSTTRYALFRRRAGATAWTPDVTAAAWQTSNVMSWTPASADVGTWEIIIWVKDGDTPATMNTYGYAAYSNAGPVQIVAPPTLNVTGTPAVVSYNTPITWTASSSSSSPSTVQYALFRRRAGATTWIPAVTSPAWQTSTTLSWTPTSADAGTWEIYFWVKDSLTPAGMNTYGYAAGYNAGQVRVVSPLSGLSCSVNPSAGYSGTTFTWTANASGGDPSTLRYALFRRRAGTTSWTPSTTAPAWQSSNTMSWTPASADAGTWEISIWAKDGASSGNVTCNPGNIKVLAPLTVTGTGSPSSSPYGATITWTATASGGDSSTLRYAFFRRRAGASSWTPDVTAPSWQSSRTMSWTPTSADVGTWEIIIWVKDGYTPSTMNTYGFAAYYNAGLVDVTTPAPVTVTGTASPSTSPAGTTISWTATASGGIPSTYKYALFRRKAGTSNWIPDVTAPSWQSSRTMSWTPSAADVGTWEIIIWVKDVNTTPTQNTYGFAAYYNAQPVQVY